MDHKKHKRKRTDEMADLLASGIKVATKLFLDATDRHKLTLIHAGKKFRVEQGEYPKIKIVKSGSFASCLQFIIDLDRPIAKIVKENKIPRKK